MKKMLSLAAVIVAMSAGGAMADLAACSTGQLRNWADTGTTTGGNTVVSTETACYTGGSGNEADCDRSGNLVQVSVTTTITYPGFAVYSQPGAGDNQCLGPQVGGEPTVSTSCDISRTRGTGGTDFDYCDS